MIFFAMAIAFFLSGAKNVVISNRGKKRKKYADLTEHFSNCKEVCKIKIPYLCIIIICIDHKGNNA